MAKISLRAYHREIESLIESNAIDEAVAHCRQILKTYPKCVDTYRLLGKAYLEAQRFSDAADILQRVLSSIPDDFVSHVGMSIIREDEGHVDEAIGHMERAFEVQPANSAIQEELRRLYGRRDGFEPPKIRLTRGALSRMYAKGDLYLQAIAELRAALGDDPQRFDLQTLLARVYFQAGQRVEAAETCNLLLRKLPYCLEANRIMADILSASERAEEAIAYYQRVQALDPYTAHLSTSASTSDRVPDQAVTIERLDWAASQGVASSDKEALPDWLSASGAPPASIPQQSSEEAVEESSPDRIAEAAPEEVQHPSDETGKEIPSWMQEAGWEPSSGSFDESASPFIAEEGEESVPSAGSEELSPADIPDWLRSMAPIEGVDSLEEPQETRAFPWLEGDTTSEELPSWLAETQPADIAQNESARPEAASSVEASPAEEVSFDEASAEASGELPVSVSAGDPDTPEQALETPVWTQPEVSPSFSNEVQSEELAQAELPDWLSELQPETGFQGEIASEESPALPAEELPDWMKELEGFTTGQTSTDLPTQEETPLSTSLETPDWMGETQPSAGPLDSLADDKTLLAAEAAGLTEGDTQEGVQPDESPTSKPITEGEQPAESAFAMDDMDAAFAWLESLAVKQGAEEALLLSPEERSEQPPEWVQESASQSLIGEDELPSAEEARQEEETMSAAIDRPESTEVQPSTPGLLEQQTTTGTARMYDYLSSQEEIIASTAEEIETLLVLEDAIPSGARIFDIPPVSVEPSSQPTSIYTFNEEPILGDTKPIRVRRPETPTVQPEALVEAVEIEPTAAEEEIPSWLQELVPQELDSEKPVEMGTEEGEAAALPAADLPEWLQETRPALASETETATGEPEQAAEEPSGWQREVHPETETGTPSAFDTTAASPAEEVPEWLQETRPILTSEDEPIALEHELEQDLHAEKATDWTLETYPSVQVEEQSEAEAVATEPDMAAAEIPEWLQELQPEEKIVSSDVSSSDTTASETSVPTDDMDAAFAWLESLAVKQGAEEALLLSPEERREEPPEWIQEAAAEKIDTEYIGVYETPPKLAQPQTGDQLVEETLPELPSWLAETLEPVEEEGWQPPTSELVEEPAPVKSAQRLDINTASLVELERLPGIGFIIAQKIVSHRAEHGPFNSLDDLLQIAGFGQENLEEIRHWVVEPAPQPLHGQLEAEQSQPTMAQAKDALLQGDLPGALEKYSVLIKVRQSLPEVIRALEEALYRYPTDSSLWLTLGDACMRSDRLQEALDAYIKAEELL